MNENAQIDEMTVQRTFNELFPDLLEQLKGYPEYLECFNWNMEHLVIVPRSVVFHTNFIKWFTQNFKKMHQLLAVEDVEFCFRIEDLAQVG